MFSELVDNGFGATETGSYEFVAKRLLWTVPGRMNNKNKKQ